MGPASYFGSGAKPKWPKPEAHRAESSVFGEGQPAPFRQLGDLGSAGAETRPLKGFLAFYIGAGWPLLELVGAKFGEPCPH